MQLSQKPVVDDLFGYVGDPVNMPDTPETPDLESLLAPTWKARARAEYALQSWIFSQPESDDPWPEPVQVALRALQPTPAQFLSALLGFWGGVHSGDANAFLQSNRDKGTPAPPADLWSLMGDHRTLFPMTPIEPKPSRFGFRGLWVMKFFERLGPLAADIEAELLACLDASNPELADTAEKALGNASTLSDHAYLRFVEWADAKGTNGFLHQRAKAIARHTTDVRVSLLLDGVQPSSSESAQIARFAILRKLEGEAARAALPALVARLNEDWPNRGHAYMLWALDTLCLTLGADAEPMLPAIRKRATHDDVDVRSASATFLARNGSDSDAALLITLANDPHPWVRGEVCHGLMTRHPPALPLMRILCGNCLGNYDGFDGAPHYNILTLFRQHPTAAAELLPEILQWWNQASTTRHVSRDETLDAMRLCEALTPHVDCSPMLDGLRRALDYLENGGTTVELPPLNEPGSPQIARNAIESDLLADGNPPDLAAAIADLHGAVLTEIANDMENWQAEIDRDEADERAEWLDLFPELATELPAENDVETEDSPDESNEDDLVVELRALIKRLAETSGVRTTT